MIKLPLDLDGSLVGNRKTTTLPIREVTELDQAGVYHTEFGIFHPADLVITHVATGAVLTANTDYILTYQSRHLYATYDLVGYGAFVLTNKTLTGNLSVTANYLGGGYGKFNASYIVSIVNLSDGGFETLDWDMVIDAPGVVKPNSHSLPAANIATGYEDQTAMLWQVSKQLKAMAEVMDQGRVPIGTEIKTILPNPYLTSAYWHVADGSTLTREDHPAFFEVLNIEADVYVLPNTPLTYIKVR